MQPIDFNQLPDKEPREERATEKQLDFLRHLGEFHESDLSKLGKWQASFLIEKLLVEQGEDPQSSRASLRRSRTRKSKARGCVVVLVLLLLGICYVSFKGSGSSSAPVSESSTKDTASTSQPPPKRKSIIPLFHNIPQSIQFVYEAGLLGNDGGKPEWRHSERGWHCIAKKSGPKSGAPADEWEMLCIQLSATEGKIDSVAWVLKQREDLPTAPTFFQDSCTAYCRKLGCPFPDGLFANVDPANGNKTDTLSAVFEIRKQPSELGHGWCMTITEN